MLNVAINGLGRIGRATLKIVVDKPGLRLTAVNDVLAADNLAYLLKFDTVYGRWKRNVSAHEIGLNIDGKDYRVMSERDPSKLPWRPMASTSCSSVQARLENETIWQNILRPGRALSSCRRRRKARMFQR